MDEHININKIIKQFTLMIRGHMYEYNGQGKLIHAKYRAGTEKWYDTNGKCIHDKNSEGFERWYDYDACGNMIHEKDSNGSEWRYEYDKNGVLIMYDDSNGNRCGFNAKDKISHAEKAKNVLASMLIDGPCNQCPGCHRSGYFGTEKCPAAAALIELDPNITYEDIRNGKIST